jgi:hypothetical protein
MQHPLDDDVAALHTIEDNVVANWVTPQTKTEVIARSPQPRPVGKKIEAVGD